MPHVGEASSNEISKSPEQAQRVHSCITQSHGVLSVESPMPKVHVSTPRKLPLESGLQLNLELDA